MKDKILPIVSSTLVATFLCSLFALFLAFSFERGGLNLLNLPSKKIGGGEFYIFVIFFSVPLGLLSSLIVSYRSKGEDKKKAITWSTVWALLPVLFLAVMMFIRK